MSGSGFLEEDKHPVLNRSKPTAWLNDVQIDIEAVFWKNLKQGIWRSECKLSVFFAYPLTFEVLLNNIEIEYSSKTNVGWACLPQLRADAPLITLT